MHPQNGLGSSSCLVSLTLHEAQDVVSDDEQYEVVAHARRDWRLCLYRQVV